MLDYVIEICSIAQLNIFGEVSKTLLDGLLNMEAEVLSSFCLLV